MGSERRYRLGLTLRVYRLMARLRRDTQDTISPNSHTRPLRIAACGTLFLTHTLDIPSHPEPSAVVRAHSVTRSRGGSAATCSSIIAQFPSVEAMLVAPLGGNEEGCMILRDLEREKVSTRYCKIWEEAGVPSAWVLHADDTDTRTVINNNPLPDITHEEFVSLLGPILAPENYSYLGMNQNTPLNSASTGASPRPSVNLPSPNASPAPLDWIHFEGRSVKTTLSNIMGLDGLARERKWRSHCVFSVDVGRRARQGIEALIPHVDVVFLNKHYARAHSPHYAASPRAFLLSLTTIAPPHALLVAHWGSEGAAVLSIPTKEYFQSSGWVDTSVPPPSGNPAQPNPLVQPPKSAGSDGRHNEVQSVRTGSGFWAMGHHTESSSEFTAGALLSPSTSSSPAGPRIVGGLPPRHRRHRQNRSDSDSSDSDGTEIPGRARHPGPKGVDNFDRPSASNDSGGVDKTHDAVDEVGAQDAFIAGMIYALSRRIVPGEPYTPSAVSKEGNTTVIHGAELDRERDRGKWRLEECLRFATELAGRKARRKGWDGLAEEMTKAGWFEG
ncbi:hypothetical protein BDY19DRAFT_958799 [Irpex rosettiformis]|uniref:Uncharacterized protein n=1 Tax=Irpex rosettiformis TaxID=378272 RepID=A0ACB8TXI7_9APHY|nr:hypothetical protein BDY19DRAFT_958799 [Irpex rosettiformis]